MFTPLKRIPEEILRVKLTGKLAVVETRIHLNSGVVLLTCFGSEIDAECRDHFTGRITVQLSDQQIIVLHTQRKLLHVCQKKNNSMKICRILDLILCSQALTTETIRLKKGW